MAGNLRAGSWGLPAEKHWASIREAGHDLLIKNGVQELASSPKEGQMGGWDE